MQDDGSDGSDGAAAAQMAGTMGFAAFGAQTRPPGGGGGHGGPSSSPSSRQWWLDYYDPRFNENPWDQLEKSLGLEPRGSWLATSRGHARA
ncbi:hypothetical protein MAPG_10012 [Magnaporthiopsis poae ATCC 64411]|uniref:Uncharacterized protein n=1 Tax=Magnaporthiopsis poae (strain ATCC 64411 / 73-15) TaxID=644358 RepID=A0A0C4EBG5_MAGP6|nr:hypothetical protein MAPG_10012 [Magnaporthiopsis poae ATCC 64411]